ncbi:short chain dehydrogenase [Angomonas deanei]|uniref:Short chain dehydrogenase/KR domain/Enoyl-(Acyl carrier protein) reductase, putative n=1 Tax=Angomonas deanei TaxID=59799 RepID=S9UNZ3_9TRYP|nr:short chain dehydrogenase [Angomonas deanei]EPY43668.1 short chain dehydrogenase [Angomonas deanei]CAD2213755.1 short chain dehydrogenase/KR domain/Enoyl-(Acyl carrier protein) reductase, putative [Angomonas deanei]|eukprot:EPY30479.1 short chain dehydrogenase [Angomonas deanei]
MKTVLITGANRGIGLETARQMGKLGYAVIVGSRNAAQGEEAVKQLQSEGIANVESVELDITSDESVKKAYETVHAKHAHLDVLINNAGIAAMNDLQNGQINLDSVLKAMQVNLISVIRVTNQFLELVKAAPEGRIVNLSSIMASLTLHPGDISYFPYNASKTALNMYTVNLADALKDTKVKVNSAHPGWVQTDMGGEGADLPVAEGAETSVYLATLPADGPTGGFFHKKDSLPW